MNDSDKKLIIDLLTQAIALLQPPAKQKKFRLPEPPSGRVWYNGETFKAGDLPEGFRPLMEGEKIPEKAHTDYYDFDEGDRARWTLVTYPGNLPVDHRRGWPRAKLRTNAPLPKTKKGKS